MLPKYDLPHAWRRLDLWSAPNGRRLLRDFARIVVACANYDEGGASFKDKASPDCPVIRP